MNDQLRNCITKHLTSKLQIKRQRTPRLMVILLTFEIIHTKFILHLPQLNKLISNISINEEVTATEKIVPNPQKAMSDVSSGLDSCEDWLRETPTSGWGSFWERSSFFPWFFLLEIRDVTATGPEWNRACGFRKIHLVVIRRPKSDFPSYWTPETVSLSLSPNFL